MFKKTAAFLITLCLLGSLCIQSLAAQTPQISLTSHEAKAGDSVKITLSVKDFSAVTNPKDAAENTIDQLFSAVQLKIYYDSSALDIVEYGAADEKNGTPSPVKISGSFAADICKQHDEGGDYIYFSVMCTQGEGASLSDDESIAEITMKVKSGAKSGTYELNPQPISLVTGLKGLPTNVIDQFALHSGQIQVKGADEPETPDTSDTPDSSDVPDSTYTPGSQDDRSDSDPENASEISSHDKSSADRDSAASDKTQGSENDRDENNPGTGSAAEGYIVPIILVSVVSAAISALCILKRNHASLDKK